jgi:hypothetical protein
MHPPGQLTPTIVRLPVETNFTILSRLVAESARLKAAKPVTYVLGPRVTFAAFDGFLNVSVAAGTLDGLGFDGFNEG